MTVDVAFIPMPRPQKVLKNRRVVVIDVLRASTSIVTALANGAKKVIPFLTPEEAKAEASKLGPGRALLCGERDFVRIPGFDLGNSPAEYTEKAVRDKIILYTSTNGSQVLVGVKDAAEVMLGGFINIGGVVDRIGSGGMDITIACSGSEGAFSLEDTVCAGMIVHRVSQNSGMDAVTLSDEARAAAILYARFSDDLEAMLFECKHGRILESMGMGSDLPLCARVDVSAVVPVFLGGALIHNPGTVT